MKNIDFGKNFEWGTATASYQIEGGFQEDGKGESIWDRFTHQPGNIQDGTNGDTACDFYHLYEEDIKLAHEIGIGTYRFSISWPRILPDGRGEVNQEGILFYRKVLQCIRDLGMKSCVTLYHWDLPQKLQDKGGWSNREIVGWFEDYVRVVFENLGDLTDRWITLNEPYCTAVHGYWTGEHAPGYHDYSMMLTCVHHLMMAHGAAVKAYRETGLKAEIGITLNMNSTYPFCAEDSRDVEAAKRVRMQSNDLIGDPVLKGIYPEDLFIYLEGQGVVIPEIREGDMELIHQEIDFLGLNSYFSEYVKADDNVWPLNARVEKTGKNVTDADWEVNPSGMYDLLMWIQDKYHPNKIIITENGAACNDWVDLDHKVKDPNRIDYLKRYLVEVHHAIENNVPVKGYYIWCFCDNFEWAWGLKRRFGIVYVDYETQERIPKESAYWFRDVIQNSGFSIPDKA